MFSCRIQRRSRKPWWRRLGESWRRRCGKVWRKRRGNTWRKRCGNNWRRRHRNTWRRRRRSTWRRRRRSTWRRPFENSQETRPSSLLRSIPSSPLAQQQAGAHKLSHTFPSQRATPPDVASRIQCCRHRLPRSAGATDVTAGFTRLLCVQDPPCAGPTCQLPKLAGQNKSCRTRVRSVHRTSTQ